MHFNEPRPRKLLKGIAPPAAPAPLAWYNGAQNNAIAGNAPDWGWLLSPGYVPPSIATDSPIQANAWVKFAHEWLNRRALSDGANLQVIDQFPQWHEAITRAFHEQHPELNGENTPAMRRPWLDAAVIDIVRTRNGVEVRYASTGLIAIGIHSGIQDQWVMPPSLGWHRQHFAKFRNDIAKYGHDSGAGKKAMTDWHTYCRKNINQPGGFNAWSLGDPFMRGWVSGRIHISEMPFSVVLYNLGALGLVDIFQCYSTHKDVFDYIRTHKRMDLLLEKVRSAQAADPLCKKFPRSMVELPVGMLAVHGE